MRHQISAVCNQMYFTRLITIIFALFLLPVGKSQVQVSLTRTTPSGTQSVCPNDLVIFTCQIMGSGSLVWSSAEYLGQTTPTFLSSQSNGSNRTVNGVFAILTQVSSNRLESELRIRANMNSSIRCLPDDSGSGETVNLVLKSEPRRPIDVSAFEISSSGDICAIRVEWDPPTDTPREDIRHYILHESVNGAPIVVNTTSTLVTFQSSLCTSSLYVNVSAVDRCGQEGPSSANITPMFLPGRSPVTTQSPSGNDEKSLQAVIALSLSLLVIVLVIILIVTVILISCSRQQKRKCNKINLSEECEMKVDTDIKEKLVACIEEIEKKHERKLEADIEERERKLEADIEERVKKLAADIEERERKLEADIEERERKLAAGIEERERKRDTHIEKLVACIEEIEKKLAADIEKREADLKEMISRLTSEVVEAKMKYSEQRAMSRGSPPPPSVKIIQWETDLGQQGFASNPEYDIGPKVEAGIMETGGYQRGDDPKMLTGCREDGYSSTMYQGQPSTPIVY